MVLSDQYTLAAVSFAATSQSGANYFLLLYAKFTRSPEARVYMKAVLAGTSSASFYLYPTLTKVSLNGMNILSVSGKPSEAWELGSFTENGVGYRKGTVLAEGSAAVDPALRTASLSASWELSSGSATYLPPSGTVLTANADVSLPEPDKKIDAAVSRNDITLPSSVRLTVTKPLPGARYTWTATMGGYTVTPVTLTDLTESVWQMPLSLAGDCYLSRVSDAEIACNAYIDGVLKETVTIPVTVRVPDCEDTKPDVTLYTEPEDLSLPAAFAGIYLKGKTGVNASVTATPKLGATVWESSKYAEVEDEAYTSGMTSDPLSRAGTHTVRGFAADSRGFRGEAETTIYCHDYETPRLVPYRSTKIVCERSNAAGTPLYSGTNLHIKCACSYAPVTVGGVSLNDCSVKCRHKTTGSFGAWITIHASCASSNVVDFVVPAVFSDLATPVTVELKITDTVGETTMTTVVVPAARCPLHLAPEGKAAALGQFCESGTEQIYMGWPVNLRAGIAPRLMWQGSGSNVGWIVSTSKVMESWADRYTVYLAVCTNRSYLLVRKGNLVTDGNVTFTITSSGTNRTFKLTSVGSGVGLLEALYALL